MIGRRAASSAGAAAVAVLAGTPLCRGSVGVLVLRRHRVDGVEHLGGHVARQRIDHPCQVCTWGHRARHRQLPRKEKDSSSVKQNWTHLRC